MNGMKADDYVPGSIRCSLDIIASHADVLKIIDYFSDENEETRPNDSYKRFMEAFFIIYRELTQNIPRMIYDCYFIP